MLTAPLPRKPRNPNCVLRPIILERSSTIHLDRERIPASCRSAANVLKQIYQGPMEIHYLGERAVLPCSGVPSGGAATESPHNSAPRLLRKSHRAAALRSSPAIRATPNCLPL